MKKPLLKTRGIKHWFLSGYASILASFKFGITGQRSSPQSLTAYSLDPFNIRNITYP